MNEVRRGDGEMWSGVVQVIWYAKGGALLAALPAAR